MSTSKFSFDLDALRSSIQKATTQATSVAQTIAKSAQSIQSVFENGTFKTSTVSLGSDPRVGTKPALVPPSITSGEIKLDGLFNPYTVVNFQIARQVLDANNVVAFKVYRKATTAAALGQANATYSKSDFDQISNNSTKTGKFSQDKKAQYAIAPDAQPQVAVNPNLFDLQQTSNSQNAGTQTGTSQFSQQNLAPLSADFQLVATINYADQQAQAQLKQVYVSSDATVTSYYEDHSVSYGASYVYAVTAYCKTGEESARSSTISMLVLNLDGIEQPMSFSVHQVDETSVQVGATFNAKDKIKRAHLFRRDTKETRFEKIATLSNVNNMMRYTDNDVTYLSSYIYRVILENIFGAISEPQELSITCSVQRAVDKTRSHNLLFPIMLTSQDPNSDGIRITIYPNDARVLYYQLDKINLSTNQRRYGVPINKSREYWASNKFFVQTLTGSIASSSLSALISSGSLPAQTAFTLQAAPIVFVDNYVTVGNIQKYRVTGFDKSGNSTASTFSIISSLAKNALRAPVNVTYDVLREAPFRVKIRWSDDNATQIGSNDLDAEQRLLELNLKSANLSAQQEQDIENLLLDPNIAKIDLNAALATYNLKQAQLAAIKTQADSLSAVNQPVRFVLQRREANSANFSSWPATVNQFLIDEVPCADPVAFEAKLVDDKYVPLSNSFASASLSASRPFGLPSFMSYDKTWEYRVAALGTDGSTSAYSTSIFVSSNTSLTAPQAFSGSALNPNVTPSVVVLTWQSVQGTVTPDHFRIERKENVANDPFVVIGNSYLGNTYYDRGAQIAKNYVYRIRSVSALNAESLTMTTNVST